MLMVCINMVVLEGFDIFLTLRNCLEVQDQRPLELELVFRLVKSPRGVHFGEHSIVVYNR